MFVPLFVCLLESVNGCIELVIWFVCFMFLAELKLVVVIVFSLKIVVVFALGHLIGKIKHHQLY